MSTSESPSAALENALLARGEALAREHTEKAEAERRRILAESAQTIERLEAREQALAEARGERAFHRQVQAAEIRLAAELDRVRWSLVGEVMAALRVELETLARDEARYCPIFEALLAQAAGAIERDELVAVVNEADLQRCHGRWAEMTARAAPGKALTLSPETAAFSGGVLLRTPDDRIRVDNTFEGRIERLERILQGAILKHLFPEEASPAESDSNA